MICKESSNKYKYFYREFLSQSTLNWLLEKNNPSVRYFTLKNLLDKKKSADEIIAVKKQIMFNPPVTKILKHQNSDGSFLTDKMIQKYGKIRAKSGYLPKYKATIWQAIFLAQLGADKNDERIKKLCNYILDTNYSKKYKTIGSYYQRKGKILFFTMPCYLGNMVLGIIKIWIL